MDPRLFTPEEAANRRAEAARLTRLLEERPGFSYVRFGDGEQEWVLLAQSNRLDKWGKFSYAEDPKALRQAYCVAGLHPEQLPRLMQALNQCSYLDYYDQRPGCKENLRKIQGLQRAPDAERNATPQVSAAFYEWVMFEMAPYVAKHKCLFVGAESPLLAQLWRQPGFRKAAEHFFPPGSEPVFLNVRDNGRNYADNLDMILADLKQQAADCGAHTVFVALATGAKVICHELSQATGVRTYDFGSMLRALTYSGTPGHQAHPSSHCPYFFTVSLADYMQAWERTEAGLAAAPLERLRKMHGQLNFDLLSKVPMGSFTTSWDKPGSLDLSPENLRLFRADFAEYRRRLPALLAQDPAVLAEHRHFMRALHWAGVTWRGRVEKKLRAWVKKCLGKGAS